MSVPSGLSRGQLLGLASEEILVLSTTRCSPKLEKAVELEEEIQASQEAVKQASSQARMSSKHQWLGLSQHTKGSTKAIRSKPQYKWYRNGGDNLEKKKRVAG